ncbi:unnamed protein product [Ilex paraguariensis]|uniref:Uncharacterized protein n=2 Tax=Ilex paraguariensis TaxID=185542 RepID=A0ABC8QX25_9AQUA
MSKATPFFKTWWNCYVPSQFDIDLSTIDILGCIPHSPRPSSSRTCSIQNYSSFSSCRQPYRKSPLGTIGDDQDKEALLPLSVRPRNENPSTLVSTSDDPSSEGIFDGLVAQGPTNDPIPMAQIMVVAPLASFTIPNEMEIEPPSTEVVVDAIEVQPMLPIVLAGP